MSLTVEYKGSQIAQLTQNGSLTLNTQGTYCEDDIELTYSSGSGGVASGEFTLQSNASTYTITHNLGTKRVVVVAQRINSDKSVIDDAGSRYAALSIIYFSKEALAELDTAQGYRFSSGTTQYLDNVTDSNGLFPVGLYGYFGAANDTHLTINGSTNPKYFDTNSTLNSITVQSNYPLYAGRWVWFAYALPATS